MNGVLLVLIVLVIAAIAFAVYSSSKATGRRNAATLADAKADARRVIERLGGQVLNLTGTDDASKQAMADASERYTAAASQIDQVRVLGDQLKQGEERLAAVQGIEVAALNRELEKRKLEPLKAKSREEWEKQSGARTATAMPAFLPFTFTPVEGVEGD